MPTRKAFILIVCVSLLLSALACAVSQAPVAVPTPETVPTVETPTLEKLAFEGMWLRTYPEIMLSKICEQAM